jgi:predicted metal-dependent hydrolase
VTVKTKRVAETEPELDPAHSYYGTCQACFGTFVVQFRASKKWAMVLHGYQRPGDGAIRGRCWGENKMPYELDCEVTKAWLKHEEETVLPIQAARRDALVDDDIDSLNIEVRVGWRARKSFHTEAKPKYECITIGRDYRGCEEHHDVGTDFEHYRQRALLTARREYEETRRCVETLARRVREWKYDPKKLRANEVARVDAAIQRAKASLVDQKKFLRKQKQLWKRIAEAINDHKNGCTWIARRAVFMAEHPFPTDEERKRSRARAKKVSS